MWVDGSQAFCIRFYARLRLSKGYILSGKYLIVKTAQKHFKSAIYIFYQPVLAE